MSTEAHVRIDEVEIYGLYDPDTNELRYIGKARNSAKRLKGHLYDRQKKTPVYAWIRVLVDQGKTPALKVIERVGLVDWPEAERRLVAEHGRTNSLLNLAPGGNQPSCTHEQHVRAAKASNKAQSVNPRLLALSRAKRDTAKLYAKLCKTPDVHAYTLRLLMKCRATLGNYPAHWAAL